MEFVVLFSILLVALLGLVLLGILYCVCSGNDNYYEDRDVGAPMLPRLIVNENQNVHEEGFEIIVPPTAGHKGQMYPPQPPPIGFVHGAQQVTHTHRTTMPMPVSYSTRDHSPVGYRQQTLPPLNYAEMEKSSKKH